MVSSLAELRATIAQPKLTVVDFFATWCGPCKMVAPHLEQLAQQKPNVNFLKVDVDQAQDIAMEYRIEAMPTFKFFKNGAEIEMIRGADINRVQALVQEHETVPPPAIPDDATLNAMSGKELMAIMRAHHINAAGLLEKQEFITEIKKYRR